MTTYGAYNNNLPCQNTSCKSHGKPHPNCRCYGDFASGGEVKNYCASANPHKDDCEYYISSSGATLHGNDPYEAAINHIAHGGIHGLLDMKNHHPDHAMKKYDHAVKKGSKKFQLHLDHLFEDQKLEDDDFSDSRKSLDEWITKGGVTNDIHEELYKQNIPQNFAVGGNVKKRPEGIHGHPIEHEYPAQNLLLQTVKGRASGYLSGLKPMPNQPKLAFDREPDQRVANKSYHKALDIAAHPLSILKKIKKGTIEPEDVKHFVSIHPELNDSLQKKLTERIIQMQVKGKKPNYKVRQGLSLLLGTPLSGEVNPSNIQAAQAVFQTQASPQQKGGGNAPPKKLSALSKSSQEYLTPNEAAASRQQKQ